MVTVILYSKMPGVVFNYKHFNTYKENQYMSNFICDKCRTCAKFPFCEVVESKDGDCGEYKSNLTNYIEQMLKEKLDE